MSLPRHMFSTSGPARSKIQGVESIFNLSGDPIDNKVNQDYSL
jgi:hypothetical protein